jgi:hypothetical protein
MPGFVYVMSNPSFVPGRVKIGKSDRDPEKYRRDELHTTGVPEPFHVEYYAFVEDHDGLEQALHRIFSAQRVYSAREFFDVPTHLVVLEIRKNAEVFYEKKCYSDPAQKILEESRSVSYIENIQLKQSCERFILWARANPMKFVEELIYLHVYNPSYSPYRKFRDDMVILLKEERPLFEELFGLMCDCFEAEGLASFSSTIMDSFPDPCFTEIFLKKILHLCSLSKEQSFVRSPDFSNGSWLVLRAGSQWRVFWEERQHPGSWSTSRGGTSLTDYKKYYKYESNSREFSIVINEIKTASILVPEYLKFDTDGLYFHPDVNTIIRLRCLSLISGMVEISSRGHVDQINWEDLPNCYTKKQNKVFEERGMFGFKKIVQREIDVFFFGDEQISHFWVSEVQKGWRY